MQVTIPLSSTIAFSRLDASQTSRPHVFLLTSKEELLLSLDSFTRSTTEIDFQATYTSLYLPISPCISLYLPISPNHRDRLPGDRRPRSAELARRPAVRVLGPDRCAAGQESLGQGPERGAGGYAVYYGGWTGAPCAGPASAGGESAHACVRRERERERTARYARREMVQSLRECV